MTTPPSGMPPAGWYADPTQHGQERWWDGAGWTHYQQPVAQPQPEPDMAAPALAAEPQPAAPAPAQIASESLQLPAAAAPEPQQQPATFEATPAPDASASSTMVDPALAAAALRAPTSATQASQHQFAPPSASDAVPGPADPFGAWNPTASYEPVTYRDVPFRSSTVSVWLIVFSPLLGVALWTIAVGLLLAVGDPSTIAPAVLVFAVALSFSPFFWAARDRRVLRSFGFERPAHWAWMFLSPLGYLIARYVRTRSEAARGAAPLVVYAVLSGLWVAASTVSSALMPPEQIASERFVDEFERGIREEGQSQGIVATAQCPDADSAFAPNKSFDCIVTLGDGRRASVTITWGKFYWQTPAVAQPVPIP